MIIINGQLQADVYKYETMEQMFSDNPGVVVNYAPSLGAFYPDKAFENRYNGETYFEIINEEPKGEWGNYYRYENDEIKVSKW